MDNCQSYPPCILWEPGESCREKLAAFSEHEMRETLDGAILKQQESKLSNIDWVSYRNYHEFVQPN